MLIGAIDGGGTKLLAAILTADGTLRARRHAPAPGGGLEAYFGLCAELLGACARDAAVTLGDLSGVGVALPGMTDGNDRVLGSPSSGWGAFDARALLAPRLGGLPVFIENDVNACALAEMRFACGGSTFVWMTVSTGIGGAVVADGRLIRGANGCAGELGHLKGAFDNPAPCGCGARGCLEAHASGTAIRRMAREAGLDADAKQVEALAAAGDGTARAILDTAGRHIGRGLAMAANILNPAQIFIGGGVSHALPLFLPALREAFAADALPQCRDIPVTRTGLGYDAALFGAAAVCLDGLGITR